MAAATSSHVIEVMVIAGEELHVSRRQKVQKNSFVIVRADGGNAQRTNMDKDGGSYPSWNEKIFLNLPMHARYVTVEVYCKTQLGDRIVGTAKIPTSDFLGGYAPLGYLHFLSYRLRDADGERNGIINLSLKVKTPENAACIAGCSRPWSGAPADDKVSNGIATGVPLGYRY